MFLDPRVFLALTGQDRASGVEPPRHHLPLALTAHRVICIFLLSCVFSIPVMNMLTARAPGQLLTLHVPI